MWHVAEGIGVSVTQLNRTGGDTLLRFFVCVRPCVA